jgi:hypothetical protein
LNDSSILAFETVHGRGSLDLFRKFLPPAETEPILLPENAGVWLRKTGR